jgi:hypothetical protein
MKLPSKKHFLSASKVIITLMIGSAITFLFQEPLKRYFYELNPKLEYHVLSSQQLDKSELLQLLYSNFKTSKVDFSMDDNIITGYHYTVVELTNKGCFIKDDLLFDLDFKNEDVKILAVLCKMIEPEERELKTEIERPPLEFQLPKKDMDNPEVKMCWLSAGEETGAIVYRSYSKHGGFGRRNPTLIVDRSFSEKLRRGGSYYYAITYQYPFWGETGFGEILFVPTPEFLFNKPSFKDTISVRAHNQCDEIDAKLLLSEFNKAKTKLKRNAKIFVHMNREDFGRIVSDNIGNLPVYFNEDVKFLHGRTTLRLNSVMRKAKIRFYIISKTYLKYDNRNLTLSLRDTRDIELKKVKAVPKEAQKQDDVSTSKELLTPYQVKLLTAKDKVIIAWAKPKTEAYKGVRIFRSPYSKPYVDPVWGKELYEGPGIQGLVVNSSELTQRDLKSQITVYPPSVARLEPPPRKDLKSQGSFPAAPKIAPPTGLKLVGDFILNGCNGELMPFYEDHEVTSGNSYIYTVVAYDDKGEYSYPVESIIKHESTKIQDNVNSFSEYQNDLGLLQVLKAFYNTHQNTTEAKQVEAAISVIEERQKNDRKP